MAVRYAGFKVRTECKHCGHPLPLHGLSTQVPCGFCFKDVELPQKVLVGILECFEDDALHLQKGVAQRTTLITGGFTLAVEYRRQTPRCEQCEAEFPVADIALGTESDISCVQCGDRASTSPVPQWLRRDILSARQYYSSEPQIPTGVAATGHDAPTPVVMACPQCAGTLRVTEASERIMRCEYCTSDVFLPDAIWRRLHPVKVLQEWFVRFDGPTQEQLDRDRERQQQQDHETANQRAAKLYTEQAQNSFRAEQKQKKSADQKQQRLRQRPYQGFILKPRAWFAAIAMWAGLCALLHWQLSVVASLDPVLPMSLVHEIETATPIYMSLGGAILALLISIWWVGAPLKGAFDDNAQIFISGFWVVFTIGPPLLGTVVGFAIAFILWRGTPFTTTKLKNGEGKPAALLFLAFALPGQLSFTLLIAPHRVVPILKSFTPWLF